MRHFYRICALGVLLTIVSCGPRGESPGTGAPPNDKKSDQSLVVEKSYNLDGWDGCTTSNQVVKASSKQELTKAYCDRLQDGNANNSCAETQRLKLFIQDCPARTWQPTESYTGILSGITKRRAVEDSIQATYPKLESLTYLKIDKTSVTPGLTAADVLMAEKAINVFRSCGFSNRCLMLLSLGGTLSFHYFVWQPESVSALVVVPDEGWQASGLNPKPQELKKILPLHIIFQYSINDHSQNPTVEVWRETYPRGFRSYKEFLADSVSSEKLLNITTTTEN